MASFSIISTILELSWVIQWTRLNQSAVHFHDLERTAVCIEKCIIYLVSIFNGISIHHRFTKFPSCYHTQNRTKYHFQFQQYIRKYRMDTLEIYFLQIIPKFVRHLRNRGISVTSAFYIMQMHRRRFNNFVSGYLLITYTTGQSICSTQP